jgi:DNA-binding NarL/FixJ family response regulator
MSELRDPAGLALAALTAIAARLVQPSVGMAIAAGLAVLAVKSIAAVALARSPTRRAAEPLGGLTRKEVKVARLVGLGLSNKEIASRLGGRSERTVDSHVQHIFEKLGFRSRSQIAAWASEHGLLDGRAKSASDEGRSAPK